MALLSGKPKLPDPADTLAILGLFLIGSACYLLWSLGVALLVVGVIMLLAVLIGMVRRPTG